MVASLCKCVQEGQGMPGNRTTFGPKLPLCLAGDASAYGVGAVLSHVLPDGSEHPVAYASRTLNSSERNYAQVEKEALSLIFGLRKFHQYIYGRTFTLVRPQTTYNNTGPKADNSVTGSSKAAALGIVISWVLI